MSTYLISGVSRGIGRDLARLLVDRGHRVLAVSRNEAELSRIAEELSAGPGTFHYFPLDLSSDDWSDWRRWVTAFTPLDGLVNNAGYLVNKPFGEVTDADWQAVLAVNLIAPARLCRALSAHFAPGAHVVNVGSMGGYQGSGKFPGLSAYSAAKGGLAILTECLAEEWKDRKITVNCLALGAVNTEMLATAFPGYEAPLNSDRMAEFMAWFLTEGRQFFNGKILPVALHDP